MDINKVESPFRSVARGIKCGTAFSVFGVVGIPVIMAVYKVGAEKATVFLSVPLIIMYIAWRTLQAFIPEAGGEKDGPQKEAAGRWQVHLAAILMLIFFLTLTALVLCAASGFVYFLLGMGWAVTAIRSIAEKGVAIVGIVSLAVSTTFLLVYNSKLIFSSARAFVSFPYKATSFLSKSVSEHHAH